MLLEHQQRVRHQTVARMVQYGGRFEHYIAEAWYFADEANRQKLEEAFGELFEKYA